MLTIRQKGVDALERQAVEAFLTNAVAHLRQELPDLIADIPHAKLLKTLESGRARAIGRGFTTLAGILAFVDAGLMLEDPAFDTNPENWWAAEILDNPYMSTRDQALAILDAAWATAQNNEA